MQVLCYKEDYGRPEEEQERRTQQLRAAAAEQLDQQLEEHVQEDSVQEQVVHDANDLRMHAVALDEDDDIQTTEVILAIESIPENGDLLVGHMVQ